MYTSKSRERTCVGSARRGYVIFPILSELSCHALYTKCVSHETQFLHLRDHVPAHALHEGVVKLVDAGADQYIRRHGRARRTECTKNEQPRRRKQPISPLHFHRTPLKKKEQIQAVKNNHCARSSRTLTRSISRPFPLIQVLLTFARSIWRGGRSEAARHDGG